MLNNELPFYLAFSYCLGIGPMTFKIIKSHPKGVQGVYEASKQELFDIFKPKLAEKFITFRHKFNPIKELEKLKKDRITVLPVDSPDYPESLKNISDPPICLYVKGSFNFGSAVANLITRESLPHLKAGSLSKVKNLPPLRLATFFAIVGTRKPTAYGVQVAKKFSYELAEAGFVIVSGLAMGIDTIAHQAALDVDGKTVAVLGCGVNVVYPAINRRLYEHIIKSGGAVLSEFPPDQTVLKGLFISRNRIISGLSRGVLIAEGGEFSGALITAKYAGIQGKDVFAVPSPINSNMSNAPNLLIKQGAKLVTSVKDIFEEFNMKISPRKKEDIRSGLDETEKMIYDLLEKSPQTIDDLVVNLGKSVHDILNITSRMEIDGIVEKNQENKCQIRL